jgi:tetratricopeptide (TPR) repeat protein
MVGCFTEAEVLRLLDGRVTPGELQEAEQHLDGCAECRALVAATAAVMPASAAAEARADAAVEPGALPRRIGRYLVRGLVGTGGMSTVYSAFDPQLGRRVALKLLKPEVGGGSGSRARLVREAQAMARLQHAHVVTVHDLGVVGDQLYIAMELVDGQTLGAWLRAEPRPWRDVVRTFIAAGRGLAAAHGAGIVHRDFKPENVLVARDGTVRVTDFGVARVTALAAGEPEARPLDDDGQPLDAALTVSGALLGTPVYMAPEQLMGEPVDARADIFSYCAGLYEALYRQRPFVFRNMAELRAAVCSGKLRPPPPGHGVPDVLGRIVERGLMASPDARWPSMQALDAALEEALRAPSSPQRRFVAIAAAVAVVLAVAGGVVAWTTWQGRAHRAEVTWTRQPWQRRAIALVVKGDGNDATLARALEEHLRNELALGSELRIVPAERDRLGAQLVLDGHARTLPDGRAQLTVEVRDSGDGRPLAWVEDAAMADALPRLTADVAARLRQQLALQAPSADDEMRVRAAMPSNATLAAAYADGLAKLRRFDADGARKALETVIAADPQQPLAWAALAEAWHQLQYQRRYREAARQAFDRADKLPREQRLWVEAQYREAMKEWPAAIELYRSLATFFPDNLEYGLKLADAQVAGGKSADALATLDKLAKLPPPDGSDARIDLSRAQAKVRAGDSKAALPLFAAARAHAGAVAQRQLLARILVAQCSALDNVMQIDAALATCADAERAFAEAGDRAGVARAKNETAAILVRAERYKDADLRIKEALDAYRAVGSEAGVGLAMMNLGIDYKRVGKLAEAQKLIEGAAAQLAELNEPYYAAFAQHILAAVQTDGNQLVEAEKHYKQSITMAHDIHLETLEAEALSNYSNLLLREARADEALDKAEQSVALYRTIGTPPDIAYSLDSLGLALMQLDRLPEARKAIEEALKTREKVGWAGGASRQNLAELTAAEGKYAQAEAMAKQAVDEVHARNMGVAEAYARTMLADILYDAGKTAEATREATAAIDAAKRAGTDIGEAGLLATLAMSRAGRGEVAAACKDLRAEGVRLTSQHQVMQALWATYGLAEIEVDHGLPTARQTLRELAAAAAQHDLRQLARKTAALERRLR